MFVPIEGIGISVARVTGMLYFIAILPELNSFIRTDGIKSVLLLTWLFFLWLTIISIFNINEYSKVFFNISIFQNILLFTFLINHARKDYLVLEKGMLFYAFGSILMSVLYLLNIGVEYEEGRLSMFKENQNALGLNMVIGILILSFAVIQNKLQLGRIRYILLLPIPLMINFIFATGSRTVFIALILGIIISTILYRPSKASLRFVPVFIGIAILFLLLFSVMQFDVMRERLLKSAEQGDLASRDIIWRTLLPLIQEHPIIGVGDTGYQLYTLEKFGGDKSPHNVIIEVMCLSGAIGLIFYLSFLANIFSKGYQSYKGSGLLLPILLAIPLMGAIFSGQILTRKIGWITFAYIIGSTAIKLISVEQVEKVNNS